MTISTKNRILSTEKIVGASIILLLTGVFGWAGTKLTALSSNVVALQIQQGFTTDTLTELKGEVRESQRCWGTIALINERMIADDLREQRDIIMFKEFNDRISQLEYNKIEGIK